MAPHIERHTTGIMRLNMVLYLPIQTSKITSTGFRERLSIFSVITVTADNTFQATALASDVPIPLRNCKMYRALLNSV